jgi:hypothetical protein
MDSVDTNKDRKINKEELLKVFKKVIKWLSWWTYLFILNIL